MTYARDTVTTERWGSHFWACTFCAAVMGRRHETGPRNGPPQTEAEVRALANASGDSSLSSGSNTRELIRAVSARYHRSWRTEANLSSSGFLSRARTPGVGIVMGCNASRMPSSIRRHYGSFGGGHRTFLANYGDKDSAGRVLVTVLDPMMPAHYAGVKVRPEELTSAAWLGDVIVLHAPREVPPPPPPPAVALKYHGTRYGPKDAVIRGDNTNVRRSPYIRDDNVARQLDARDSLRVYQRTTEGTNVSGSRVWYGTADGNGWVHSSVVTIR